MNVSAINSEELFGSSLQLTYVPTIEDIESLFHVIGYDETDDRYFLEIDKDLLNELLKDEENPVNREILSEILDAITDIKILHNIDATTLTWVWE